MPPQPPPRRPAFNAPDAALLQRGAVAAASAHPVDTGNGFLPVAVAGQVAVAGWARAAA